MVPTRLENDLPEFDFEQAQESLHKLTKEFGAGTSSGDDLAVDNSGENGSHKVRNLGCGVLLTVGTLGLGIFGIKALNGDFAPTQNPDTQPGQPVDATVTPSPTATSTRRVEQRPTQPPATTAVAATRTEISPTNTPRPTETPSPTATIAATEVAAMAEQLQSATYDVNWLRSIASQADAITQINIAWDATRNRKAGLDEAGTYDIPAHSVVIGNMTTGNDPSFENLGTNVWYTAAGGRFGTQEGYRTFQLDGAVGQTVVVRESEISAQAETDTTYPNSLLVVEAAVRAASTYDAGINYLNDQFSSNPSVINRWAANGAFDALTRDQLMALENAGLSPRPVVQVLPPHAIVFGELATEELPAGLRKIADNIYVTDEEESTFTTNRGFRAFQLAGAVEQTTVRPDSVSAVVSRIQAESDYGRIINILDVEFSDNPNVIARWAQVGPIELLTDEQLAKLEEKDLYPQPVAVILPAHTLVWGELAQSPLNSGLTQVGPNVYTTGDQGGTFVTYRGYRAMQFGS